MKGRKVSQKGGGLIIRLMKNDRDTPYDRPRNFNLKSDRITWNYGVGSMLKSWVGKKKNPGVILFEDIESISDLKTERYDGPDGQGPALEWMEFEIQTKKSSYRRRGRKLYKFHNVWIPPFWGLVRPPRTVSERQKLIRDEVPSNSEVRRWYISLQEKYRIWKVGGDFPPDYGDIPPPAYAESRKRGRSRTTRNRRKSLKGRTRTSRRRRHRRRQSQRRRRRRRRGRGRRHSQERR